MLCIIIRSPDRGKAFFYGNNHIVVAAGAMHDLNAAVPVPACYDANVFIVWIKGEAPDLRVLPADRRTAAMLHSCTPAVADNIAAVCCVVKSPVYHARTV